MDRDDPSKVVATQETAILEPSVELTRPIEHQMYLRDVVFSTAIAEHGDYYIGAPGEADLACRMTYAPKGTLKSRPDARVRQLHCGFVSGVSSACFQRSLYLKRVMYLNGVENPCRRKVE